MQGSRKQISTHGEVALRLKASSRLWLLIFMAALVAQTAFAGGEPTAGGKWDQTLAPVTESEFRSSIAALVVRARSAGATLAAESQKQAEVASESPRTLRPAVARVRDTATVLVALAGNLDALARRAPAQNARELSSAAAAAREEAARLEGQTKTIESAARVAQSLVYATVRATRLGSQIGDLSDRIDEALRQDDRGILTLEQLRNLHAALEKLVLNLEASNQRLPSLSREVQSAVSCAQKAATSAMESYRLFASRADSLAAAAAAWSGPRSGSPAELALRTVTLLDEFQRKDQEVTLTFAGVVDTVQTVAGGINGSTSNVIELAGSVDTVVVAVPSKPVAVTPSFRILTYNTAFLSATIDLPFPLVDFVYEPNDARFSGLNYEDRANKIADGILRGDQEVVVLNEVFSDAAREVFIKRLSGTYPNYVAKLAGPPVSSLNSLNKLIASLGSDMGNALTEAILSVVPNGLSDYAVIPGDSGLMVFSRYPFLKLPSNAPNDADCSDDACSFKGRNIGQDLLPEEVAFHIYQDVAITDQYASKGVGVVKIDAPGGTRYVAFTHMQADDYLLEEYSFTRYFQYQAIAQTLEKATQNNDLNQHPVYLLGDLNTPGHNRANPVPKSEWESIYFPFSDPFNFFACGNGGPCSSDSVDGRLLIDSWGFETSVLDLGLTQLDDLTRFDYILHNSPDNRTCMQHVHIAWDVAEDGTHWYSDHLPIRADFNQSALYCSANDEAGANGPLDIVFPPENCDNDPATPAPNCNQDQAVTAPQATIMHPGSFQWYRIEQAGSYSIEVLPQHVGEEVQFEVYQGEDLSRPIAPFTNEKHPRWGTPYAMLNPPYYIRVFAVDANGQPDRMAADREYRIEFHQHLCRTPMDACFLPAAAKYPYTWPEAAGVNPVNTLYFKFKTSGVANGRLAPQAENYPTVKLMQEAFQSDNLSCLDQLTIEEYQGNMPPVFVGEHVPVEVEVDVDSDWDDNMYPDERFVAPDLDGDTLDEFKVYHAKVSRIQNWQCGAPMTTWVRFETNLSYFLPTRVQCFAQFDDSGVGEDDHVRFRTFFDKPHPQDAGYCDTHSCYEATFDEPKGDNWIDGVPSLRGYFVDKVTLGMWEDDAGADLMFNTYNHELETLHPYLDRVEGIMDIQDNPDPDDADYVYKVKYLICREKDGCQFKLN